MYCTKCGYKNEGNVYCSNCGNKLESVVVQNNAEIKNDSNGLRTASIVLGILGIVGSVLIIFFPISFVLSLIGLILGIVATKKGRNVAGIVLNSIGLFLSMCIMCLIILILVIATTEYDSYYDYDDDYYDDYYDYYDYDDYYDYYYNSIIDGFEDYFGDIFKEDDTSKSSGGEYY